MTNFDPVAEAFKVNIAALGVAVGALTIAVGVYVVWFASLLMRFECLAVVMSPCC